jgi:hypothetical protein
MGKGKGGGAIAHLTFQMADLTWKCAGPNDVRHKGERRSPLI